MCPTQWTVQAKALTSIAGNYNYAAKEATKDTEMREHRLEELLLRWIDLTSFGGLNFNGRSLTWLTICHSHYKLQHCHQHLRVNNLLKQHLQHSKQYKLMTAFIVSGNTLRPECLQLMCYLPLFHGVQGSTTI